MKRILVTGSRSWIDVETLETAIWWWVSTNVPKGETTLVVHGDCPQGADRQAREYARAMWWLQDEAHPADWSRGKSAGFTRNQEMVDLGADVCLAFIRDGSAGASHTAARAEAAGIPTLRYVDNTPAGP